MPLTHIRQDNMNNNNDNILTIEKLKVIFELEHGIIKAVDGIDLQVPRGKTLALVGESGCGKSVTAYSILNLIQKPGKIANGKITFYPRNEAAVDITSLNEKSEILYQIRGGYISMIFQEPMTALSPVHTIGDQISEAIYLHSKAKLSKSDTKKITIEMLDKVGIPNVSSAIDLFPHEISGGMRQRVVIAMAMITKPQILIADEPTTALDVTIQAQIIGLIKHLQQEFNTSTLLITHDIGVVAQSADDVAVMYLGNIVERSSVRQIVKDPMHPYTMALMDSLPKLDKSKKLKPIKGSVPPPFSIPKGCPFHPRCEYCQKGLCDIGQSPRLEEITKGHQTACLRINEIKKNAERKNNS